MKRLDQWLVDGGHYQSRERARLAVMAGEVEIEGKGRALKAGTRLGPEDRVIIRRGPRFVSRGGDKLEGVLRRWGMDISGREALDVGASTGGFTHCLLARGAARVVCLDVGRGQLHWDLRRDARVTVMESMNAREIMPGELPYLPDLVVVDVSFISLRLVLPTLAGVLKEGGDLIALVKPQYEAGRGKVGRKGIVRDPEVHKEVLTGVLEAAERSGLDLVALAPSDPKGADGNREFFAWWRRKPAPEKRDFITMAEEAVREAWASR